MSTVLVPVRFPLSRHSRATLEEAAHIAGEREAELIVLHVNLYQNGKRVTRGDLRDAVEAAIGRIDNARYLVDRGFLVEEKILEEVAAEVPDVVVIGHKQLGRLRQAVHKLVNDPDIATYLEDHIDCELVIVPAD